MSFYKPHRISKVLVPILDSFYMFYVIVYIYICIDQVRRVTIVSVVTTRLSHRYYQKAIFFVFPVIVVCLFCL